MVHFTIAPLRQDQVACAYPLVRTIAPDVTLEHWRRFAGLGEDGRAGALVLTTDDGIIHGLATWRLEQDLTLGRLVAVDHLITFELTRSAPARPALCAALEAQANELGCSALTIRTSNRGLAAADFSGCAAWQALGYTPAGLAFAKRLKPRPSCDDHAGTLAVDAATL